MTTEVMTCAQQVSAAFDARLKISPRDALLWLDLELESMRRRMPESEWLREAELIRQQRELMDVLRMSPLTDRALVKPRGYAGDAVMMDILYAIPSGDARTPFATGNLEALSSDRRRPGARAVRARRRLLAERIDTLATQRGTPRVASIAAGHARELELSEAAIQGRLARFVALDQDPLSLAEIARAYASLGAEPTQAGVVDLLRGRGLDGTFDLIYSTGLYDYLDDRLAAALTARLIDHVGPRGTLLIANFAKGLPDRGYMEAVMDWRLIYRDELDLVALVPEAHRAAATTFRDPTRCVAFLSLKMD